ncbi:hypothetical protein BGZ95_005277 [Linnemannia exigua]|uniref:Uncharacterized protein n=1 Tax=Linnemannia exigua TaxID=604196 RepID=A0AAD4D472_9FUNG|nr:hypothetical protein BGZ95_005277 [Linnemannia exigua]
MTVVLPEFEPPPMYHRQDDEYGLHLPTYGDISNTGIDGGALGQQQQQSEEQEQGWVVLPPLSPTAIATTTITNLVSDQNTGSEVEEIRVPISTTPSPTTSLPLPEAESLRQQRHQQ